MEVMEVERNVKICQCASVSLHLEPLPAQASNHPAIFPVTVTLYSRTACSTVYSHPISHITPEDLLVLF